MKAYLDMQSVSGIYNPQFSTIKEETSHPPENSVEYNTIGRKKDKCKSFELNRRNQEQQMERYLLLRADDRRIFKIPWHSVDDPKHKQHKL